MSDAVLRCPKCGAGMVTFQRGGIVLEECARCQGVFLGRAELDRLLWRPPAQAQVTAFGHPAPFSYEGRHRRV
jgi:uncharacterized protein